MQQLWEGRKGTIERYLDVTDKNAKYKILKRRHLKNSKTKHSSVNLKLSSEYFQIKEKAGSKDLFT